MKKIQNISDTDLGIGYMKVFLSKEIREVSDKDAKLLLENSYFVEVTE